MVVVKKAAKYYIQKKQRSFERKRQKTNTETCLYETKKQNKNMEKQMQKHDGR